MCSVVGTTPPDALTVHPDSGFRGVTKFRPLGLRPFGKTLVTILKSV